MTVGYRKRDKCAVDAEEPKRALRDAWKNRKRYEGTSGALWVRVVTARRRCWLEKGTVGNARVWCGTKPALRKATARKRRRYARIARNRIALPKPWRWEQD